MMWQVPGRYPGRPAPGNTAPGVRPPNQSLSRQTPVVSSLAKPKQAVHCNLTNPNQPPKQGQLQKALAVPKGPSPAKQ